MKKIKVDKDSHGTIGINWAVISVLIACTLIFIHNLYISIPITVILLAFAFFVFWFHRVPDRDIPEGDSKMITSIADGKVVIVDRVYEKEYFKDDRIQVSVYMDFFDVHTNFWPMDGEISYYKYHPGKYLLAFLPKASEKTSTPPQSSVTSMESCCSGRSPALSQGGLSATQRGRQCRERQAVRNHQIRLTNRHIPPA